MLPTQIARASRDSLNRDLLPRNSRSSGPTVGGGKRRTLSKTAVRFAAGGYMICSSFMLIANKLAVHNLPAPQFVLFSQLFASGI